jgi:hypothetical protein
MTCTERCERDGVHGETVAVDVDHVERWPEACGFGIAHGIPAEHQTRAPGRDEHEIAGRFGRASQRADSRIMLVPVEHDDGPFERVQCRECGPGAERGHHPLLVVCVRDDPGEHVLREPLEGAVLRVGVDAREIRERGRDQVMVREQDQRIVARRVAQQVRDLEQVRLTEHAAGADESGGHERRVDADDTCRKSVRRARDDLREERCVATRDVYSVTEPGTQAIEECAPMRTEKPLHAPVVIAGKEDRRDLRAERSVDAVEQFPRRLDRTPCGLARVVEQVAGDDEEIGWCVPCLTKESESLHERIDRLVRLLGIRLEMHIG